jgi:dye decolorizing peroxidase/deferrochelatase/peroxidase EfeB
MTTVDDASRRLGRRDFLGRVAIGAGGVAVGALATSALVDGDARARQRPEATEAARATFVGEHQPGIASAQPRHLVLAAFDLAHDGTATGARDTFRDLMRGWTAVGEAVMSGGALPAGPATRPGMRSDPAIATGLDPAGTTMTIGFGSTLFATLDVAAKAPTRLRELPAFAGDDLDPAQSAGDLIVQLCGDDAQVLSHAFRAVRTQGPGRATLRWTQFGFLSAAAGETPRNLLGQKDGTANAAPGTAGFDDVVWSTADEPDWFAGGTYLVFRKIRLDLPGWDLTGAAEQDAATGRHIASGAPLSGGSEHSPLDLDARASNGELLIPATSHVRLVHGIPMFRRSYNYDYGFVSGRSAHSPHEHDDASHDHPGPQSGHARFDAGTLFLSYQRDPAVFVDAQTRLATTDALNRFLLHTASGVYAVPPGIRSGAYVGEGLLT